MTELVVRDVEPALVAVLQQRADMHRRSIEEEHKAILHEVLLATGAESQDPTFEAYLRQMPDVGEDMDFARIEGSINDVNLSE